MSDTPSALAQRGEREFDEVRFREQLNWLIENRRVAKKGRFVRRTKKSIVAQIHAQHPDFTISATHFGNLASGKRQVTVTLQLAVAICHVFGSDNLDFFLDPNMERQRHLLLEPVETFQQRRARYEALEQQAAANDEGIMAALRGVPEQDLAVLERLIILQIQTSEVRLLKDLRALPADQRAAFEQLIRSWAT